MREKALFDKPLVSCLIPTHNRAPILSRAIDSVLQQTYGNIELFVIDNLSTDKTKEIVDGYIRRDNRVNYLSYSTAANAAATRNFGLKHAKGEYIAFLDDDDYWEPNKISEQIKWAEDYSVVGCRYITIRNHKRTIQKIKHFLEDYLTFHFSPVKRVELKHILENNSSISPSNMLIKSDFLREIGGFLEDLPAAQGRDLFIRLIKKYGPAAVVNQRLARRYENHEFVRITSRPVLIEGSWKEFHRNKYLMDDAQRRRRLISIYLFTALYSDGAVSDRRQGIVNALKQVRIKEIHKQINLFIRFIWLRRNILFRKGLLW
jgi:glycosyltransferase involved in cell wall biosynthesis